MTRILRQARARPILATALGIYLALSAAELVRTALYGRPRIHDAGLYAWETAASPRGRRRFRWTHGPEAYLLRPVAGAVVKVPLVLWRPDVRAEGEPLPPPGQPLGKTLPVLLELHGRPLDRSLLDRNGWFESAYYLPPILGPELWAQVLRGWEELEPYTGAIPERREERPPWFQDLGPSPRRGALLELLWRQQRIPDYRRVLTQWHRPPGPPSIWLHVTAGATFVPAELAGTNDARELGVGVGELEWGDTLPPEGIGFYAWETAPEGVRFRWTRQRASIPVEVGGSELIVDVRADHPDLLERPVAVEFYWGVAALQRVVLRRHGWHEVRLSGRWQVGDRGVLSLFVERVWNPYLWSAESGRGGISHDTRYLGVAVTEPRWE